MLLLLSTLGALATPPSPIPVLPSQQVLTPWTGICRASQIMLLGDPEIESSILISSDEGATYQKYRLTFYIQSLLFHPKQEDWVLAYSLDQKVNPYSFHSHLVPQLTFLPPL
ncbi:hypothetical protein CB1_000367003 [Camelus ferus]|nr:hypothetical protein CB1_000367003 [Camelus ferus]